MKRRESARECNFCCKIYVIELSPGEINLWIKLHNLFLKLGFVCSWCLVKTVHEKTTLILKAKTFKLIM